MGEIAYMGVFDNQLPAALKKLPFDKHLSTQNVRKVVSEADGYQPHLIAPEQGYRRLIDGALALFKVPAEASVDAELMCQLMWALGMVCDTLRLTIPKVVVHCQVREAKRSLLNYFYAQVRSREKNQLGSMLDEEPGLMEKREAIAGRLQLTSQPEMRLIQLHGNDGLFLLSYLFF